MNLWFFFLIYIMSEVCLNSREKRAGGGEGGLLGFNFDFRREMFGFWKKKNRNLKGMEC